MIPVLVVFAAALAAHRRAGVRARLDGCARHRGRPGRARARQGAASQELPEVIDLFALAVGGGLNVSLAVAAVGHRAGGALGAAFRRAAVDDGRRLADRLDDLPRAAGEELRPLTAALAASERYGSPLGDVLARAAHDARIRRLRRAEEAARRLPVLLLFPLVCCVLPAFVLLTVVPMLAGSLRALRLS